jgi:hypothetical protein
MYHSWHLSLAATSKKDKYWGLRPEESMEYMTCRKTLSDTSPESTELLHTISRTTYDSLLIFRKRIAAAGRRRTHIYCPHTAT